MRNKKVNKITVLLQSKEYNLIQEMCTQPMIGEKIDVSFDHEGINQIDRRFIITDVIHSPSNSTVRSIVNNIEGKDLRDGFKEFIKKSPVNLVVYADEVLK